MVHNRFKPVLLVGDRHLTDRQDAREALQGGRGVRCLTPKSVHAANQRSEPPDLEIEKRLHALTVVTGCDSDRILRRARRLAAETLSLWEREILLKIADRRRSREPDQIAKERLIAPKLVVFEGSTAHPPPR